VSCNVTYKIISTKIRVVNLFSDVRVSI